ncbi:hypothetical protein TPHA_0G01950 [Tetrapisispora phaffii CBS 4417]|uniref:dolichyl-phosphate-mannose--protein mannosyltransferase n=1 Tax=Tetrapisispora phaffii (strain ATCC 24235 / CBS 4417 / NBRC 1672 / NRRL Y-8282 / UCD 70-5) TaxID=1071381 RepID=G8BVV3_TETPH|nr:hypothetical protein TPHA_0G01950 [Tetrapisispora phaffii CBS 4417]CCE64031.1 hypothetical protein TPHA_0G01950 [Tetrapisispora phaffii CBS 4417]
MSQNTKTTAQPISSKSSKKKASLKATANYDVEYYDAVKKKLQNKNAIGYRKINLDDTMVQPFTIEKGPKRNYIVTDPPAEISYLRSNIVSFKEFILIVSLLLFTCYHRLYNLEWPNSVVFDEVHFGKFAAKYIKREFFFDVHPPLAKMSFALVGYLAGFNGIFEFNEIGDEYPFDVPYYTMRLYSALTGVATVMLAYFTLRSSGVRIWIAVLSACCLAVENSFVTISRHILLDSPLIFCIALSAFFYKRHELYEFYSRGSLVNLFLCGVSLGFAASAKWVGLFTIAWIGVLCLFKLWFYIGDLNKSFKYVFKTAIFKFVFLLVVPAFLYILFFAIHMNLLSEYSIGAAFLSPEFKATLNGNDVQGNFTAEVGVGSVVTLRHTGSEGGYLHSHNLFYPAGSQQQQISLYAHNDDNNKWLIELFDEPNAELTSFRNITDKTKIRLKHFSTRRRLHSHDHKAPVSEFSDWQKEVSAYGDDAFEGDPNDDWIVEIVKEHSAPGEAQEHVRAIETKFRLRHAMSGCLLFSHPVKYPEWGAEQQEVTCAHSGKDYLTEWYIEENYNEVLPEDADVVSYIPLSFWEKFKEFHVSMWVVNAGLSAPHPYESWPSQWPFLSRGLGYWGAHHRQIYLLGNAIIWWSVSIFIAVFLLTCIGEIVSWQVDGPVTTDPEVINFHYQVLEYLLGFFAHFIPSFIMKRQMFLHHYLPAYYFGILAFGQALDIVVSFVFRHKRNVGYITVVCFFAVSYQFFKQFSPLIYGTEWTIQECGKSQWLPGWDYPCPMYLESLDAYKNYTMTPKPYIPSIDNIPDGNFNQPFDGEQPNKKAQYSNKPIRDNGPVANWDDIARNKHPKKFVDQFGNTLNEEEVKRLMEQDGASIIGSTQTKLYGGTADQPNHRYAPPPQNNGRQQAAQNYQQPPQAQQQNNVADVGNGPLDEAEFEKILNNGLAKQFVDQNGNQLNEAQIRSLLKNGGASLLGTSQVKKRVGQTPTAGRAPNYKKQQQQQQQQQQQLGQDEQDEQVHPTSYVMNEKERRLAEQRVKELDAVVSQGGGTANFIDPDGNTIDVEEAKKIILEQGGSIGSFGKSVGTSVNTPWNPRNDPAVKERVKEFEEIESEGFDDKTFLDQDGKRLKPAEVKRLLKQNNARITNVQRTTYR